MEEGATKQDSQEMYTNLNHAYWKDRLPRSFQFYMDRLARAFVRVQPSNGSIFAFVMMDEMLSKRNTELEQLPEVSYLERLKDKSDRRGGGDAFAQAEAAEYESVANCVRCGRTSRGLQTPVSTCQECRTPAEDVSSILQATEMKPRPLKLSCQVQTVDPPQDRGVQVSFGMDMGIQVTPHYVAKYPGHRQPGRDSIIILSPTPMQEQGFRPVSYPDSVTRPQPRQREICPLCDRCSPVVSAIEDKARAELKSEYEVSRPKVEERSVCNTSKNMNIKTDSVSRSVSLRSFPSAEPFVILSPMPEQGFRPVSGQQSAPRTAKDAPMCDNCVVSAIEERAREDLKSEQQPVCRKCTTPERSFKPIPGPIPQSRPLDQERQACDKCKASSRPPSRQEHFVILSPMPEQRAQPIPGPQSPSAKNECRCVQNPVRGKCSVCGDCVASTAVSELKSERPVPAGRGTPAERKQPTVSPIPAERPASRVRYPSTEPYAILSPMPGQGRCAICNDCMECGSAKKTNMDRKTNTDVSPASPRTKTDVSPASPRTNIDVSPTSPRILRPSPQPYAILSPMEEQGVRPVSRPAQINSPVQRKTENPIMPDLKICPRCNAKRSEIEAEQPQNRTCPKCSANKKTEVEAQVPIMKGPQCIHCGDHITCESIESKTPPTPQQRTPDMPSSLGSSSEARKPMPENVYPRHQHKPGCPYFPQENKPSPPQKPRQPEPPPKAQPEPPPKAQPPPPKEPYKGAQPPQEEWRHVSCMVDCRSPFYHTGHGYHIDCRSPTYHPDPRCPLDCRTPVYISDPRCPLECRSPPYHPDLMHYPEPVCPCNCRSPPCHSDPRYQPCRCMQSPCHAQAVQPPHCPCTCMMPPQHKMCYHQPDIFQSPFTFMEPQAFVPSEPASLYSTSPPPKPRPQKSQPAPESPPQRQMQSLPAQTVPTRPQSCQFCSAMETEDRYRLTGEQKGTQTNFPEEKMTTISDEKSWERVEDAAIAKLTERSILDAMSATENTPVKQAYPCEPECTCAPGPGPQAERNVVGWRPDSSPNYMTVSELPDNTSRAATPADEMAPINVNVNVEVESAFDSNLFMQQVKQQISEAMGMVISNQQQAVDFHRQCLQSDEEVLRELELVAQPRISAAPTSPGSNLNKAQQQGGGSEGGQEDQATNKSQKSMQRSQNKGHTISHVEADTMAVKKNPIFKPSSVTSAHTEDCSMTFAPHSFGKGYTNDTLINNSFYRFNKTQNGLSCGRFGSEICGDEIIPSKPLHGPKNSGCLNHSETDIASQKKGKDGPSSSTYRMFCADQQKLTCSATSRKPLANFRYHKNDDLSVAKVLKCRIQRKCRYNLKRTIAYIDYHILPKSIPVGIQDWVFDWILGNHIRHQVQQTVTGKLKQNGFKARSRVCPRCFILEHMSCFDDFSSADSDTNSRHCQKTETSIAAVVNPNTVSKTNEKLSFSNGRKDLLSKLPNVVTRLPHVRVDYVVRPTEEELTFTFILPSATVQGIESSFQSSADATSNRPEYAAQAINSCQHKQNCSTKQHDYVTNYQTETPKCPSLHSVNLGHVKPPGHSVDQCLSPTGDKEAASVSASCHTRPKSFQNMEQVLSADLQKKPSRGFLSLPKNRVDFSADIPEDRYHVETCEANLADCHKAFDSKSNLAPPLVTVFTSNSSLRAPDLNVENVVVERVSCQQSMLIKTKEQSGGNADYNNDKMVYTSNKQSGGNADYNNDKMVYTSNKVNSSGMKRNSLLENNQTADGGYREQVKYDHEAGQTKAVSDPNINPLDKYRIICRREKMTTLLNSLEESKLFLKLLLKVTATNIPYKLTNELIHTTKPLESLKVNVQSVVRELNPKIYHSELMSASADALTSDRLLMQTEDDLVEKDVPFEGFQVQQNENNRCGEAACPCGMTNGKTVLETDGPLQTDNNYTVTDMGMSRRSRNIEKEFDFSVPLWESTTTVAFIEDVLLEVLQKTFDVIEEFSAADLEEIDDSIHLNYKASLHPCLSMPRSVSPQFHEGNERNTNMPTSEYFAPVLPCANMFFTGNPTDFDKGRQQQRTLMLDSDISRNGKTVSPETFPKLPQLKFTESTHLADDDRGKAEPGLELRDASSKNSGSELCTSLLPTQGGNTNMLLQTQEPQHLKYLNFSEISVIDKFKGSKIQESELPLPNQKLSIHSSKNTEDILDQTKSSNAQSVCCSEREIIDTTNQNVQRNISDRITFQVLEDMYPQTNALSSCSHCAVLDRLTAEKKPMHTWNSIALTDVSNSPVSKFYQRTSDFNRALVFFTTLFKLQPDMRLSFARCVCLVMLKTFHVESLKRISSSKSVLLSLPLGTGPEELTWYDWKAESDWSQVERNEYDEPVDYLLVFEHRLFPWTETSFYTETGGSSESNTNGSARTNSPTTCTDSEISYVPAAVQLTSESIGMKINSSVADGECASNQTSSPSGHETAGYDGFQSSSSSHRFKAQTPVAELVSVDKKPTQEPLEKRSSQSSPQLSYHLYVFGENTTSPFLPCLPHSKSTSVAESASARKIKIPRSLSPRWEQAFCGLLQENGNAEQDSPSYSLMSDNFRCFSDWIGAYDDLSTQSSCTITQNHSRASGSSGHCSLDSPSDVDIIISASNDVCPEEENLRRERELSELEDFVSLEKAFKEEELRKCEANQVGKVGYDSTTRNSLSAQSLWLLESIPEEDEEPCVQDVLKNTPGSDSRLLTRVQDVFSTKQFAHSATVLKNGKKTDFSVDACSFDNVKRSLPQELVRDISKRADTVVREHDRTSHICRSKNSTEGGKQDQQQQLPSASCKPVLGLKDPKLSSTDENETADGITGVVSDGRTASSVISSTAVQQIGVSFPKANAVKEWLAKTDTHHKQPTTPVAHDRKADLLPDTVRMSENSLNDTGFESGDKSRVAAPILGASGLALCEGQECRSEMSDCTLKGSVSVVDERMLASSPCRPNEDDGLLTRTVNGVSCQKVHSDLCAGFSDAVPKTVNVFGDTETLPNTCKDTTGKLVDTLTSFPVQSFSAACGDTETVADAGKEGAGKLNDAVTSLPTQMFSSTPYCEISRESRYNRDPSHSKTLKTAALFEHFIMGSKTLKNEPKTLHLRENVPSTQNEYENTKEAGMRSTRSATKTPTVSDNNAVTAVSCRKTPVSSLGNSDKSCASPVQKKILSTSSRDRSATGPSTKVPAGAKSKSGRPMIPGKGITPGRWNACPISDQSVATGYIVKKKSFLPARKVPLTEASQEKEIKEADTFTNNQYKEKNVTLRNKTCKTDTSQPKLISSANMSVNTSVPSVADSDDKKTKLSCKYGSELKKCSSRKVEAHMKQRPANQPKTENFAVKTYNMNSSKCPAEPKMYSVKRLNPEKSERVSRTTVRKYAVEKSNPERTERCSETRNPPVRKLDEERSRCQSKTWKPSLRNSSTNRSENIKQQSVTATPVDRRTAETSRTQKHVIPSSDVKRVNPNALENNNVCVETTKNNHRVCAEVNQSVMTHVLKAAPETRIVHTAFPKLVQNTRPKPGCAERTNGTNVGLQSPQNGSTFSMPSRGVVRRITERLNVKEARVQKGLAGVVGNGNKMLEDSNNFSDCVVSKSSSSSDSSGDNEHFRSDDKQAYFNGVDSSFIGSRHKKHGRESHLYDNQETEHGRESHFYDNQETERGRESHLYDNQETEHGRESHLYDNQETERGRESHFYDNQETEHGRESHFYDNQETEHERESHFYDNQETEHGRESHFYDNQETEHERESHLYDDQETNRSFNPQTKKDMTWSDELQQSDSKEDTDSLSSQSSSSSSSEPYTSTMIMHKMLLALIKDETNSDGNNHVSSHPVLREVDHGQGGKSKHLSADYEDTQKTDQQIVKEHRSHESERKTSDTGGSRVAANFNKKTTKSGIYYQSDMSCQTSSAGASSASSDRYENRQGDPNFEPPCKRKTRGPDVISTVAAEFSTPSSNHVSIQNNQIISEEIHKGTQPKTCKERDVSPVCKMTQTSSGTPNESSLKRHQTHKTESPEERSLCRTYLKDSDSCPGKTEKQKHETFPCGFLPQFFATHRGYLAFKHINDRIKRGDC